jgi:hypothetical protein
MLREIGSERAETDRGAGPIATPAPHETPASENSPFGFARTVARAEFPEAAFEVARGGPAHEFESLADDGAAEAEINAAYRQRLSGLRRMRRHERAQAVRAAREWRFLSLKALRDKRARDRRARYEIWRSQQAAPGLQ